MLQTIKKVWLPCIIYWAQMLLIYLFLCLATEEWMILGILAIIVFRLMLWASPLVLSAIVWGCSLMKPRRPVREIILLNSIVLIVNFWPFYATYLLTGGWY